MANRTESSDPAVAPTANVQYGIGDAVPDLSAATLDGQQLLVRDPDRQRPTALVFLSPWCESYLASSRPVYAATCRDVRERVASLARSGVDIRWIGISSGLWSTRDRLRVYEQQYSPEIPLTMDESGDWFRLFGVTHVPTIVITASDGTIVQRMDGTNPEIGTEIEQAIQTIAMEGIAE